MSNNIMKKICLCVSLCCIMGFFPGCSAPEKESSSSASSAVETPTLSLEGKVYSYNTKGNSDGYDYELWKDTGDTSFTVSEGGTFTCEWDNINNALFRKGKKLGSTKTYREMGNLYVDYGVDYQPNGNSYMCVYGWTKKPLIEYYIVESWGSWRPPGADKSLGTVKVDGAEYDIYRTTRVEQPSIEGTTTFDQYWSVRKTKPEGDGTRLEGTISISKHFDAWAKCGLERGKMYETALTIEGYQSSGKAVVYRNELREEGEYKEADDIEVTVNE